MEQNDKIKKISIEHNPYYFGGYANMARHNVYMILNDIAKRARLLGDEEIIAKEEIIMTDADHYIDTIDEEDFFYTNDELVKEYRKKGKVLTQDIKDKLIGKFRSPVLRVLDGSEKIVAQRKVIELLHEYFPFLNALNDALKTENPNPQLYHDFFKMLFSDLTYLRNKHSHAFHSAKDLETKWPITVRDTRTNKDKQVDKSLFGLMEIVFGDSLKKLRQSEKWKGNEKEFEQSFNKKTFDPKTEKHVKNKNYIHWFEKRDNELKGKDDPSYTEHGLAFFICQFLERDVIYDFLRNNLAGFIGNTDTTNIALDAYSQYSIRWPRPKLRSENNIDALLLDMLNELERCPAELFNRLKTEDRKKFVTTVLAEGEDGPESKLTRKQNRFPYFALRYLEHTNSFNELNFHISLGKYVFHSYEKKDGVNPPYIRRWEKPIHVFGKLMDVEKHLPQIIAAKSISTIDPATVNDETEAPYLMDATPRYHFDGNTIGLQKVDPTKNKYPDIIQSFKKKISSKTGKEFEMPLNSKPDFILATDELQGLLFYDYLANKYTVAAKAQDIILAFKSNSDRFLKDILNGTVLESKAKRINNQYRGNNDVAKGDIKVKEFPVKFEERKGLLADKLKEYNLEPHQIPERLCRYLLGVDRMPLKEKADLILNNLVADTEQMLKEVGTKYDGKEEILNGKMEKRKARVQHLRAGERATFMAKDMLLFQPHKIKEVGKPEIEKDAANPDEYKMLQAALAFFGRDKEYLSDIFRICKLTSKESPHPFLKNINLDNCDSSLEFYITYLKARYDYLKKCINQNQNSKDDSYAQNHLAFLDFNKSISNQEAMKTLARDLLTRPVNLPRGLFKDAIIDLLLHCDDSRNETMRALIKNKIESEMGIAKFRFENGDQKKVNMNVVYLLNEYYKQNGDNSQQFYSEERNYRTVDEWYDDRTAKDKDDKEKIEHRYYTPEQLAKLANEIKDSKRLFKKKNLNDEEVRHIKYKVKSNYRDRQPIEINVNDERLFYKVFADRVLENEKLIRHFSACDKMLFLMCKEVVGSELLKNNDLKNKLKRNFYLKDINPDNSNSILNEFILFPYEIKEINKTITTTIRVKEYGAFRRFMKDRRLPALLEYFGNEITKQELNEELLTFEGKRKRIFEEMYYFEKACANDTELQKIISNNLVDPGFVKHKHLIQKYHHSRKLNDKTLQNLNMVRNGFAHNQFPKYDEIKDLLISNSTYAKQLADYAIDLYKSYKVTLAK